MDEGEIADDMDKLDSRSSGSSSLLRRSSLVEDSNGQSDEKDRSLLGDLRRRNSELESKFQYLLENLQSAKGDRFLLSDNARLRASLDAKNADLRTKTSLLVKARRTIRLLRTELRSTNSTHSHLSSRLATLPASLSSLQTENSELRSELSSLHDSYALTEGSLSRLREKLSQLESDNSDTLGELTRLQFDKRSLEDRIGDLIAQLAEKVSEFERLRSEKRVLDAETGGLRGNVGILRRRVGMLVGVVKRNEELLKRSVQVVWGRVCGGGGRRSSGVGSEGKRSIGRRREEEEEEEEEENGMGGEEHDDDDGMSEVGKLLEELKARLEVVVEEKSQRSSSPGAVSASSVSASLETNVRGLLDQTEGLREKIDLEGIIMAMLRQLNQLVRADGIPKRNALQLESALSDVIQQTETKWLKILDDINKQVMYRSSQMETLESRVEILQEQFVPISVESGTSPGMRANAVLRRQLKGRNQELEEMKWRFGRLALKYEKVRKEKKRLKSLIEESSEGRE